MKKRLGFVVGLLILGLITFFCTSRDQQIDFDILIKNGRIIDGTGNPWFYGNIGIIGDTISEVGFLEGKTAEKVIDAQGMIVSPGFIDMHTHCDNGLGNPETQANLNYLSQGVTTVVTGNCGYGSFKISEMTQKWREQGIGTNAILLVGFGTVRRAVLGREDRTPSAEEMERMKSILRTAMQEGAWGLSTGLQYIPGRYASTEEIVGMARVVGEFGGIYTSHQRSEEEQLVEAVQETIRIGKDSGVRVNAAHLKASGKHNWGLMKVAVRLMNEARAEGIEVTADMYPYNKSATTGLQIIFNIPLGMEPFASLQKKMKDKNITGEERQKLSTQYTEELAKALMEKTKREKIKKITLEGDPDKVNWVAKGGWYNFTIMDSKKNKHLIGKMFWDLAKEQNKEEFEIAADLFIEEKNGLIISLSAMSEDDVRHAMKQEWVMISSDGSAIPYKRGNVHPRNYGSFPRVFRTYVREEKLLKLEEAVRKMTSLPAQLLRIKKRGFILKGYKADLVIFDPEEIRDNATFLEPHQYSSGIEYVLVNGKISIEKGDYNNSLNGRVLLLTENK